MIVGFQRTLYSDIINTLFDLTLAFQSTVSLITRKIQGKIVLTFGTEYADDQGYVRFCLKDENDIKKYLKANNSLPKRRKTLKPQTFST